MRVTKEYEGKGSIEVGEKWHDCTYRLVLMESEFKKAISGTIDTNDAASNAFKFGGVGSANLKLDNGKQVQVYLKRSTEGAPLNVDVKGTID